MNHGTRSSRKSDQKFRQEASPSETSDVTDEKVYVHISVQTEDPPVEPAMVLIFTQDETVKIHRSKSSIDTFECEF